MSRPFLLVKEREIVRKHTWLRTMRLMPTRPSRGGIGELEVTKVAAVTGTRPTVSRGSIRSKVQW